MTHVVYERALKSERVNQVSTHETYKGAAIAAAALRKRNAKSSYSYRQQLEVFVTSLEDYKENVVKKVTVKNLMTGLDVQEDNDTPHYCSVSSETYWSS